MNMKTTKETNKKIPKIKINKALEKYKNVPLFEEKLNRANETLKKVGPPRLVKQAKIDIQTEIIYFVRDRQTSTKTILESPEFS